MSETGKGSLEEMEAVVLEVRVALEAAEAGLKTVIDGLNEGFKLGMFVGPRDGKPEFHRHKFRVKKLLYELSEEHAALTEIAQRNGADGNLGEGGPGR